MPKKSISKYHNHVCETLNKKIVECENLRVSFESATRESLRLVAVDEEREIDMTKLRQELLDLSRKLTAFERECAEVRAAKAELRDLLREILPSGGAL